MPKIDVNVPPVPYAIRVGSGLLKEVGRLAGEVVPVGTALVAYDANVADHHAPAVRASLEAAGFRVIGRALVADERQKTLATVDGLYAAMLEAGLDRQSTVVAVGGGVVGDVAAFAAATYLRGVAVVQVPTTLLAMVDAAIGGKTGVNYPLPGPDAVLGKNLVGAFWQPRLVVADPETLATLPAREFRCGLAECVKHALVADATLLDFLEAKAASILALEADAVTELIARSAAIKASIVSEDEREAGSRAHLNLGHTFAHAIEPRPHLDLRHGEAVSIGLCAALSLAAELGAVDGAVVARVDAILKRLGLPVRLPRPEPVPPLLTAMGFDKKVEGGRWRLVLPDGVGRAKVVTDVDPEAIARAWHAVGAAASS